MRITFKDLENFITTAESKTLSEASEKLDISQPSLSLGIQKIEQELGYPLFIRSRSGIKLTPQGKKLLPDAMEALVVLERIKGKKTALKFRIGCHPSVGIFVLGDFLKIMHKEEPSIGFEVINSSSNEINKMVAEGTVDFGIVMNPLQVQGLIIKPIGADDVCVWESKHRYQDKLIYHPQMLQSHSIISRWKSCPHEKVEVQNLELLAHLVESGAGFGILPSQVVKAQKLNLRKVSNTPTFKDHLALTCYPEMIRTIEGKMIFEALKRSFKA
ncbi:MAG: LysR family transcriptional regulator [Bacteriovoracaceae bacterium]